MIFYIYSRYALSDEEAKKVIKSLGTFRMILTKLLSFIGISLKLHPRAHLLFPIATISDTNKAIYLKGFIATYGTYRMDTDQVGQFDSLIRAQRDYIDRDSDVVTNNFRIQTDTGKIIEPEDFMALHL